MAEASIILDAVQIQQIIPHRYPFLLVDRIIELEPGLRAVGTKTSPPPKATFRVTFPTTR